MRALAALALLLVAWTTSPAAGQEFTPAIVFDMGGKFDKSFNEAAYNGAERFKKETGIAYREFEVTERRRSASRRSGSMARRGAHDHRRRRLLAGQRHGEGGQGVPEAQVRHRRRGRSTCPTSQSVVFKEHEGSFLVGMSPAMASKTGKVGFVGGMDIPLIRKFACGYEEGARVRQPEDRGASRT